MLERVGNWVFVKKELVYTVYMNVLLLGLSYFFIVLFTHFYRDAVYTLFVSTGNK